MATGRERVLITGASGFVGACLARDLIALGHAVHLVLRPEANLWRLAGLEGRYTRHPADLRDARAVREAVYRCRPEVIYHLATHGAYAFQKDRATILATNLLGTANLLDAVRAYDYRRLVNVGSSSEYGHKDRPMCEDDRLEPRTDYAVTKAAGTLLCQAEALQSKPVATVRIFSAYGPWEDPRRLVPYVMGCCFRGEAPQVTAGEQPRDFIYVDDVVELLKTAAHHPQACGQILHAGTGRQACVRDMVETIAAVFDSVEAAPPQFGVQMPRPDEPTTWVASIERTTELTGWRPRYDLRAGVERTWAWFTAGSFPQAA
jgi:nucleoside-diphosphate-sugar epimerase